MVALWASVLSFVKQEQRVFFFFFFWGEWSFYWKALWYEETSCKHVDDGGYIYIYIFQIYIWENMWILFNKLSARARSGVSWVTQMVKNLPTMWEIQVQSLGQEDPLEKGMTTHSSILAWRIPWTEETGGQQQSMRSQRVGNKWATKPSTAEHTQILFSCVCSQLTVPTFP